SVVPIATEVGAERRMYLPLMALVACAVLVVDSFTARRRFTGGRYVAAALLLAGIAALAAQTVARNREYASALTLAQTSLARWPSPTAHGMVGAELAAVGRDDEALPELRAAADVDPRARYNLGITLFNRSDDEGAIRELDTLARQYPLREEVPLARRAMGAAYARQARWSEAVAQYDLVLSMTPSDRDARRLLIDALTNQGTSLARAGKFSDASHAFRRAVELDPADIIARHNLAMALYDSGDIEGALREARRTLTSD